MSFQQGLSGLNAASKHLDVIGNNIANANTVGAKASRAEFADVYANSIAGSSAGTVGIGTTVSTVATQFTQGDIATTSNPLDVAINGQGFFRLNQGGSIAYSRNGEFKLDKEGFIVNAQGAKLTGYAAGPDGRIATGAPVDLKMGSDMVAAKATTGGSMKLNLDAEGTAPAVAFDPAVPASYNSTATMTVYDSQGMDHALTMYFRKADTPVNTWNVYAQMDGKTIPATTTPQTLTFGTDGKLSGGSTLAFTAPAGVLGSGGAAPMSLSLDAAGVTQFGAPFGVTDLQQDGNSAGRMAGFTIDDDGMVVGRYSNGQTRNLAQIALVNFVNPQGLVPLGGNAYAETGASGQPLVSAPGSGTLGVLQSGAVENANVDLTAELVNMITAQRSYQANAQTVRTQDQVMQTLVNLR